MLLEIGVLATQPYPFLNGMIISDVDVWIQLTNIRNNYSFEYKLNHLLVLFGFTRGYVLVRVFLQNTSYMSSQAHRVCKMYNAKSHYLFAVKCLFKDYPLALIAGLVGGSVVHFALSLRIAER